MPQTKKLVIYPTSRAIREHVKKKLNIDAFLPSITTIGEFEKKAIIVKDRTFIDQDRRILLLNEASSFSNFKQLHIPREFFTFLKNSKFLFGFFDELSVELIDISTLTQYDTYASYYEHIDILTTLLSKYIELLDKHNYVDKINLPKLYTLNHSYLKSYETIELIQEGYLNNFEFKLLLDISKIVQLNITINTNQFNTKMVDKLTELGFNLKNGYDYLIDLSNSQILKESPQADSNTIYQITPTHSKITQIGFVKQKIYDYINLGIEPKDIAVILPDSNSALLLDLFDTKNNLNFAMGFPYTKSLIYKKLSALYEYYGTKDHQNRYRVRRYGYDIEKIDIEQKEWNKKYTYEKLKQFFLSLVEDNDKEENIIYHQELHLFSKLFSSLQHQPLHKVLHLFLNRLKEKTIDDTRGGKVTVLEVLETRGISYKGIILIDFNEGVVPKISQKDLFLSTELRFLSKLPTPADRGNLQKQYYKRLFEKAQRVSISYIDSGQKQPSRFLDELNISDYKTELTALDTILFKSSQPKIHYQKDDLILKYDFSKTKLSATSLKSYLDCKRSYYFRYIKKLDHAEIPKDDNSDRIIGILLHDALKNAYLDNNTYLDTSKLKYYLQSYLYQKSEQDVNLRFLVDIWLKKLDPFIQHEVQRAKDGYRVLYVEKSFNLKVDNLTLTGQIDRIDYKDNYLEVIDYKSGKIPKDSKKSLDKSSNFQLQFYHLLSSQLGEVKQSFFYDLNNSKLSPDDYFDEKLDLLYKNLKQLTKSEYNFSKTDDLKKCIYCPYINICGRVI